MAAAVPRIHGWSLLVALVFAVSMLAGVLQAFDTVVIDAGHGGKDPGTRWNRLVEKDLALDVAKRLQTALRERNLQTVMTRTTDRYLELGDRAAISNRYPGAVFVSVHFDASRNTSARGFTTHYRSKKARLLASSIQAEMNRRVPGRSRDIDWEDFKVLRETKGVAVLVECGFISNPSEAANCRTAGHRQKIADAIASGVAAMRRKL